MARRSRDAPRRSRLPVGEPRWRNSDVESCAVFGLRTRAGERRQPWIGRPVRGRRRRRRRSTRRRSRRRSASGGERPARSIGPRGELARSPALLGLRSSGRPPSALGSRSTSRLRSSSDRRGASALPKCGSRVPSPSGGVPRTDASQASTVSRSEPSHASRDPLRRRLLRPPFCEPQRTRRRRRGGHRALRRGACLRARRARSRSRPAARIAASDARASARSNAFKIAGSMPT